MVTFTPATDFNGAAGFSYTVADPSGATSTGRVSVGVTPVSDPITAGADSLRTSEDTPIEIAAASLLGNDSTSGASLIFIGVAATSAQGGTVTLAGDGTLRYTPKAEFNGSDSFTYTVSDGQGGTKTGTVTVSVAAVHDAPKTGADSFITNEDTALVLSAVKLLGNNSTTETGPLTIQSVRCPTNGTVSKDGSGNVTFTPHANFNGIASFDYVVADASGVTSVQRVSVTVNPINDAPMTRGLSYAVVPGNTLSAKLIASDIEGDALTYSLVSASNGTATVNADGSFQLHALFVGDGKRWRHLFGAGCCGGEFDCDGCHSSRHSKG